MRDLHRNREADGNPGKRRVHAGLEHSDPEKHADDHVGRGARDLEDVEPDQRHDPKAGHYQRWRGEPLGIEQRDNQDRPQVVEDRQCGQKYLERGRYPRT